MTWFLTALISAFLWGLVQTLDKLAIGKIIRYVPAYITLLALIGLGAAAIFWGTGTPIWVGQRELFLSCLSGFLTVGYTYLFLKSLETMDAPEAATILLLVPIISAALGYTFFDEAISAAGILGIFVILTGAYLATREEEEQKSREKNAVLQSAAMLVGAAVIISFQRMLEKQLAASINVTAIFFWERIAVFAIVALLIFLLPKVRVKTFNTLKSAQKSAFILVLCIEISALTAIYAQITALGLGPLSITTTLISSSPVFSLLLVSALNAIRRGAIPDSGTKKQFLPRLGAIMLTVAGVWMLTQQ